MKPEILIVNDDGIYSPGIQALADAMVKVGNITIIAPDKEQSGKSHSLTLNDPIRLKSVNLKNGLKGWGVTGTPVDCAKVAIKNLLNKKPDLVLSGINLGANLGKNLIYSGTVSAAYEGTILDIPSAAISLDSFKGKNFEVAKYAVTTIANYLLKHKLPRGTLLNVNVPNIDKKDLKGFLITKQGNQSFEDTYEKRIDPRGNSYFWIKGKMINDDSCAAYDGQAVFRGYISITPIQFTLTNEPYINQLKKKILHE
jgi:5'-nucleotidase